MPFPQDYLHDGEDLVLNLKPHWWTFAQPVSYLLGSVVAMVLLMLTDISLLRWIGVIAVVVARLV